MKILFIFSPHTFPLLVLLCWVRLGTLTLFNTVNNCLDKEQVTDCKIQPLFLVSALLCYIYIYIWFWVNCISTISFVSLFECLALQNIFKQMKRSIVTSAPTNPFFLLNSHSSFFCTVLFKMDSVPFKTGWNQRLLAKVQGDDTSSQLSYLRLVFCQFYHICSQKK